MIRTEEEKVYLITQTVSALHFKDTICHWRYPRTKGQFWWASVRKQGKFEVVDSCEPQGILEASRDAITPAGEVAPCDEKRAAGVSNESTGPSGSQPLKQRFYSGETLRQLIIKAIDIVALKQWGTTPGINHLKRKQKGPHSHTVTEEDCRALSCDIDNCNGWLHGASILQSNLS